MNASNRLRALHDIVGPKQRKPKPKPNVCNKEQGKWLVDRCHKKAEALTLGHFQKIEPEPATVIAAHKVIARWQRKQEKKKEAINTKVWAMFRRLKEYILFGEPLRALDLTKAWEKTTLQKVINGDGTLEDSATLEAPKGRHPNWDAVFLDEE